MKPLKLLLFVALTSVLISCGSDDDTTSSDSSLIAGSWDMTGLEYGGSTTTANGISTTFVGVGQDFTAVFTFNEDPSSLDIVGSYAVELTTMFDGQTITQVVGSEIIGGSLNEKGDLTWSLNGEQLTVNNGTETQILTVTTLTDDSLVLSYSDTIEVNQNGVMQSSTINGTYSFNR